MDDLLDKGKLGAGTASSLINLAIRNGNLDEKINAINVLGDHSGCMITQEGVVLPDCLCDWIPGLPDYVREWAPYYIVEIILKRPNKEWLEKYLAQTRGLIAALCMAWIEEKIPRLKKEIGVILNTIFNAFPSIGISMLYPPRMIIDADKVRKEVAGLEPEDTSYKILDIVERIKKWASLVDKKEMIK